MEITLAETTLRRAVLLGVTAPDEPAGQAGVTIAGDPEGLSALLGHLSAPDPTFAVVTP
ncbi:alkyl sulfatase C-terminal domain-containing protein [Streptomyces sp. NPDC096094]|uniref:alkyl sulfatase C-terminal domain-containing protein n=1 Tax=Streptomyces sp. NPDC096094 TaxID=3366073 RepID=UPI00382DF2AC